MNGPIGVVIDGAGNVSATLSMSTKFTAGRGATTMNSTTSGTLTGKLHGTEVSARGTVTARMNVVIKLPDGKDDRRRVPSTSPATLEATVVVSDSLQGKIAGNPGAKTLPFKASRR